MGQFKLKNRLNIALIDENTTIPESDFVIENAGWLYQFAYDETERVQKPYIVKPGIWNIAKKNGGFKLNPTSFVKDRLLEEFVNTKQVEGIIDSFFSNLHLYKEFGIEVPKRGVLIYGPAGTGKTTAIDKSVQKYANDGRTAVVVWQTDKFESFEVKDFIKTFSYDGVDKIVLVAEDLGGTENEGHRSRSDSSLLSLLDNQEKTFTIPVMIISTTNFPENFAANLTNRYGRFDDKIEIGYPPADARVSLLKFFAKEYATEEACSLIASKKCETFAPSDLREAYIRARLQNKTLETTILGIIEEKQSYDKAFQKSRKVGL